MSRGRLCNRVVAIVALAAVLLFAPDAESSSLSSAELTVVCKGNLLGVVTKEASNSFHQEYLEHPLLSIPCHRPASISVPRCRLVSSIMVDDHFEGSLMEKQPRHGIGKELIKGRRCTYIFSSFPQ
jgi:hypothetical protein